MTMTLVMMTGTEMAASNNKAMTRKNVIVMLKLPAPLGPKDGPKIVIAQYSAVTIAIDDSASMFAAHRLYMSLLSKSGSGAINLSLFCSCCITLMTTLASSLSRVSKLGR